MPRPRLLDKTSGAVSSLRGRNLTVKRAPADKSEEGH